MDFLMIESVAYSSRCGIDAPHIFDTHGVLPVPDHRRCVCGETTWGEELKAAEKRSVTTQKEKECQKNNHNQI